jgi:hypothetical protein
MNHLLPMRRFFIWLSWLPDAWARDWSRGALRSPTAERLKSVFSLFLAASDSEGPRRSSSAALSVR